MGSSLLPLKKVCIRLTVFDNQGLDIKVSTKGHRGDELKEAPDNGTVKSNRGGKRVKGSGSSSEAKWLHPDAREAMDEFFKDSDAKLANSKSSLMEVAVVVMYY